MDNKYQKNDNCCQPNNKQRSLALPLWDTDRLRQEIKDRIMYFYGQTDGTMQFPNSAEGDLLKMVNEYLSRSKS